MDETKECNHCNKQSFIYNHACLGCLARHVLLYPKDRRAEVMQDFAQKNGLALQDLQAAVMKLYQASKLV